MTKNDYDVLRRTAWKISGRADGEDLLQDIILELLEKERTPGENVPWISRLLGLRHISRRTRAKLVPNGRMNDYLGDDEVEDPLIVPYVASTAPEQEMNAMGAELISKLSESTCAALMGFMDFEAGDEGERKRVSAKMTNLRRKLLTGDTKAANRLSRLWGQRKVGEG